MKQYVFLTIKILCASAMLALSACNKDEVIEEEIAMKPEIVLGSNTSSFTVKSGREITVAPEYRYVEGAIYTWSSNGRVVGCEPSYTFSSEELGRHFLKLEVATRHGSTEIELRIDVVDLEIPFVSLPGSENGFRILTGSQQEFNPSVTATSIETEYRWTINGEFAGSETSYTFQSSENGLYDIVFTAENEDGKDSVEFTVQVCTPDEMPFGWNFDSDTVNTSKGRTVRLLPLDIENDFEVTYTWTRDGEQMQSGENPMLRFTPEATGTYTFTVEAESPYFDAVSYTLTVNVYEPDAHKRASSEASAIYCTEVFDITPAPGQFISQISTSTDRSEVLAKVRTTLTAPQDYVSLGSYGGYVVVGFDHSIENRGGYDFAVMGNSFNNSSEPGIVWVMQDENGNGLPDDTWYELKGSDYDREDTWFDYAVTYYRPKSSSSPVPWTDNRGGSGAVAGAQYPSWVTADSYTLRGSRLAARNTDTSGGGTSWENRNYEWGYADNYSSVDRITDDTYNYFKISNAVNFEGEPVSLQYVDFVKIQCAVNASSGWLGEISTEVLTVKDYNLELTRK